MFAYGIGLRRTKFNKSGVEAKEYMAKIRGLQKYKESGILLI